MDDMQKNAAWAAKKLNQIIDDLEEVVLVAEGPTGRHDPEALVHVYGSVQKVVTDLRIHVSKDLEGARKVFENVSRGKRGSLRTALIKTAYEMEPGEDRSALLALLVGDFDPNDIGKTVPSPPGAHGYFTQKQFREQEEFRQDGKLTTRCAADEPTQKEVLKVVFKNRRKSYPGQRISIEDWANEGQFPALMAVLGAVAQSIIQYGMKRRGKKNWLKNIDLMALEKLITGKLMNAGRNGGVLAQSFEGQGFSYWLYENFLAVWDKAPSRSADWHEKG